MTQSSDITYAGYLALDDLLSTQHPLSDQHDEMLFVVIHQTKELWLKQILHEMALAQSLIRAGDLVPAYKSLAQVERAFRSMKTVDLQVRPVFHYSEQRVRAHVFLCMLAYYVQWHMRARLQPMLFDD